MSSDFSHVTLRRVDKRVHRLGLALNYGIDENGLSEALDLGVNYIFYTRFRTGKLLTRLREALKSDREKLVVASGPTLGFLRHGVRRGCENLLRKLGVESLDVFQLFWLGTASAWTEGTVEELVKLREEGKVRSIGVSIHDRERAGRLAADSPLDLLMIRYNAAHPGAERDIFPHLEARKPNVVAYTATNWRKLMKPKKGWDRAPMTAGECYRFCLSHPGVDVVLTGPKTVAELRENLSAVERGPLPEPELAWMRQFGALVHG